MILAAFFSTGAHAADSSLTRLGQGFNELIYVLSRSVVTVESSKKVEVSSFPLRGNEAVQQNVSTGLVCDEDGHILVAAAAVLGQEHITVRYDNEWAEAQLVGVDYHSSLALLKTDARFGQPVTFSDQQICAGQMVIMLGNAHGLRASPSVGFCAGARPDGTTQFTVPVNPGSIGGGVFDLNGELLGLVVGSVDDEGWVAQAVPAHKIPGIVQLLLRGGDRLAGFVGITTVEIEITPGIEVSTPNSFVNAGRPGSRIIERGVVVTRVVPGSAADRAGLRPGDLIFSFRNQPVTSAMEFARQVVQSRPGDLASMELVRHNTYLEVQLRIDQKVLSPARGASAPSIEDDRNQLVADSLSRVILDLKAQVRRLESRLSSLKR